MEPLQNLVPKGKVMEQAMRLMKECPVVVSGIGGISSLGNGEETFNALFQGKSGIHPLPPQFEKCETQIGGIIWNLSENIKRLFPQSHKRLSRRTPRVTQLSLVAVAEALINAGLLPSAEEKFSQEVAEQTGCYIGTGIGSSDLIEELALALSSLPMPNEAEFLARNRQLQRDHFSTAQQILPDNPPYTASGEFNLYNNTLLFLKFSNNLACPKN